MQEMAFKIISAVLFVMCLSLGASLWFSRTQLSSANATIERFQADKRYIEAQLERAKSDLVLAEAKKNEALQFAKDNPIPKDPQMMADWLKKLESKR